MAAEALITDVQRFAVHDGPGIRTTIFFKGCPLDCVWCHNPESVAYDNEPIYSRESCIGCGDCIAACEREALALGADGVVANVQRCDRCLACTEVCPGEACQAAAQSYTAEDLLRAVTADFDFYGQDGGITLSGGEPLVQLPFLEEFLPLAKAAGLHVAAQTCGHWPYHGVRPILAQIELLMFDVKIADPRRHRRMTGRSNQLLLKNLQRVAAEDLELQVRVPLVGGCNADLDNLNETAHLLAALGIRSVTLLSYHRLGTSKRERLRRRKRSRRPWDAGIHGLRPPDEQQLSEAHRAFTSRGISVNCA